MNGYSESMIMMNRETGEVTELSDAMHRSGTWEKTDGNVLVLEVENGKVTYDISAD